MISTKYNSFICFNTTLKNFHNVDSSTPTFSFIVASGHGGENVGVAVPRLTVGAGAVEESRH